jgi:hypothetical protein
VLAGVEIRELIHTIEDIGDELLRRKAFKPFSRASASERRWGLSTSDASPPA